MWPQKKTNLMDICQQVTELHLFVYFQDDGRPPSWIWPEDPILCDRDIGIVRVYDFADFSGSFLGVTALTGEEWSRLNPQLNRPSLHSDLLSLCQFL